MYNNTMLNRHLKTVSRREIETLLVQKEHNQQVALLAKMKHPEGHLTALV